jgi:hypothetical protein
MDHLLKCGWKRDGSKWIDPLTGEKVSLTYAVYTQQCRDLDKKRKSCFVI